MLTLSLWLGMAGAVSGSMLGAFALTQVRTTLRRMGLAPVDDTVFGLSEYRALGGMLLTSHALTAAVLIQVPKVGACFAGALAAGWFGAALGRAVSLARDRGRPPLGFLALDLTLGLALSAPLWAYLRIIRAHAGL